MKNSRPIDPEVLSQIPILKQKGLSNYAIAAMLGIGESTVRKHKNYDPEAVATDGYIFTKRQLEIALVAVEKLARK